MKAASLRLVFLAVVAGISLSGELALADAVPPSFKVCMPGYERVTTHYGPKCVPNAPTDCAPGYRGQLGGACVLEPCESDQQCRAGLRCQQVDACQELRDLQWNGMDWSSPEFISAYPRAQPLPPPEGPPPKAWIKLRICGQDGPCNAPAKCRPMGLCYPADGDPKAKVFAAAPAAEVLPKGVGVRDLIARRPSDSPQGHTGCHKGCAVSSTSSVVGWFAAPLLVATARWRRRRKKPS